MQKSMEVRSVEILFKRVIIYVLASPKSKKKFMLQYVIKILFNNQYPEQLIRTKINSFIGTIIINNLKRRKKQILVKLLNRSMFILFRKLLIKFSRTNKNCNCKAQSMNGTSINHQPSAQQ